METTTRRSRFSRPREFLLSGVAVPAGAGVDYILLHAFVPLVVVLLVLLGLILRHSLMGTVTAEVGYLAIALFFGLRPILNTDPAITYAPGSGTWPMVVILVGTAVLAGTKWIR